jgi:GNAT superfamily N-acetyltransferase
MSIEIDVLNGDASWPRTEPLHKAVWSPEVMAKSSWGHIKWENAHLRVLIDAPEGDGLACHVGIYFRTIVWNGHKIHVGGIGGVMTREDCRRRGYASVALDAAIQTMRANEAVRFARSASRIISRSIGRAAGIPSPAISIASSRTGASASRRWRRSCSISAPRRGRARSTYAACHGDPCAGAGGLRAARVIVCHP